MHAKNVATAAATFRESIIAMRSKISEVVRRAEAEIRADIERQIKLVQDQYGKETRQHCKALPPSERHKLLEQFVAEGDGASLAAILKAPPHLSGLTAEQRQHYMNLATERLAPEEAADRRELAAMRDAAEAALSASDSLATHFSDDATLAKLVSDEREAEAAVQAFVNAMTKEV